MGEFIERKEKEGHVKKKSTFATGDKGRHPPVKRNTRPTGAGEEAAIYDMQANKSNKYGAVNRHLISKLKG